MKKLMLLLMATMIFSAPSVYSQAVSINKKGILKKIDRSNSDIANPKKSEKVSTWVNRGDIFFSAETEVSKNLYDGMEVAMLRTFFGQPKFESATIGEEDYNKLIFPAFVAYADDLGVMRGWEITDIIYPNAIDEAISAYDRAYELDAKKKSAKSINAGYKTVFDELYKQGGIAYFFRDYAKASELFAKAYWLTKKPGFTEQNKEVVASLAHDAGIASFFAGKYQLSVELFTEAESLGYKKDGDIYYLLYHAYKGVSETDTEGVKVAKSMLEKGLQEFPNNAKIIESLTDAYVLLGEDPAGIIPFVQQAVDKDPENPSLWNALGRVYEKQGNIEESIKAFEYMVKLIPESYGAHYSVGLLYIRLGEEELKRVNEMSFSSQEEYDAEANKAYVSYFKSIPSLEKAHELMPTDINAVDLLKSVTYRLRGRYDGMQEKYEKYNALFKSMQQ